MNVSVVIPAYNAAKYISKAIHCVLKQTVPVHEIIIVDDGSRDETVDIVEQLGIKNLKLIKQANAGVSVARNVGIAAAEGEWILLLDADDECDASLIAAYTRVVNQTAELNAIYTNAIQIDEYSEPIEGLFSGFSLSGKHGFVEMLKRNPIISPSGVLILRRTLMALGGFDPSMRYAEDVDVWLRLLHQGGHIAHVAQPLCFIRRHLSNTTSNINLSKNGERYLLEKHGLETIKAAIFEGEQSIADKQLDYLNFLIRFERWEEAAYYMEEITFSEQDEKFVSYLFTCMLVALQKQDYGTVKELLLHIIKLQPAHGASLNNLACVLAMEKQYSQAEWYLQLALSYFPGYLDATYNLAILKDETVTFKFTKRELRSSLLRYN